MQCPSCHFENMPGITSCGRCGTSLDLSTAAIDVQPPRASRTARRVRRYVPRRAIYAARDTAAEARRMVLREAAESLVPLPDPPILARLIVPGWAHIHEDDDLRGRLFLAAYLFMLALGFVTWGSDLSAIAMGLAFSVHASSILDILIRRSTYRYPRIMLTAMLVSCLLAVGVYLPAGWALDRVAHPFHFAEPAEPFDRYDVVLGNTWAFALRDPRPGDVVAFQPQGLSRVPTGNQLMHIRFTVEQNILIDRVLGAPGDRVVWKDGRLTINDTPTPWTPLVSSKLPPSLSFTVPDDRFLILPTVSRATPAGAPQPYWDMAGLVPRSSIEAGVYLRISPINRLWFIR